MPALCQPLLPLDRTVAIIHEPARFSNILVYQRGDQTGWESELPPRETRVWPVPSARIT